MIKTIFKTSSLIILATAIAGLPLPSLGQTTNKAPAEKKAAPEKKESTDKKPAAHPIRGKLAAVDKTAMTITIGKSTYHLTSETKILKDNKPAVLGDLVVGEQVTGYAKPAEGGKMALTKLNIGPKGEEKGSEKKKTN
jgi:hypothetical protein